MRWRLELVEIVVVIIRFPGRSSSHRRQAGASVVGRRFGWFSHTLGRVQGPEGLVFWLVEVHRADQALDGLFPVRGVDITDPVGTILDVPGLGFDPPGTAVVVLLHWRPRGVRTIVLRTLGLLRPELVVELLLAVAVAGVQGLVVRGRVSSLEMTSCN